MLFRRSVATKATKARKCLRSCGLYPRGLLEAELRNRDLAHPELLDLSGDGQRKLGRESDVPGDLAGRHLAAAVVADLVGGRRMSFVQPNPGAHFFAVLA